MAVLQRSTSSNPADDTIVDFNADDATTDLFKFKEKITAKTGNNGTKNVKIMVPLKYWKIFLENSWYAFKDTLKAYH